MDLRPSGATLLVTGASGFIGSKLVVELVRRGHAVRALVRPSSSRKGLVDERITLVVGDVTDPGSLRDAVRGCEGIFHLAGYARNWAPDRAAFFDFNVGGTRNLLAAAQGAGITKVVVTSTIVTFGPTPPGVVADETTTRSTSFFFTAYEESKTTAEREALARAAEGLPVVIVNPTRVYGPGKLTEANSVTVMLDLYDRGRFPFLLAGGRNVGNYALVDDVVGGHILAMEKGRVGERYILGGENASLAGLFDLVDEVAGRRHLRVSLPGRLALAYSAVEQRKAEWFGAYPRITPGWIETFLRDWAYSPAKAQRELGYTVTPLREGVALTCQWLRRRRARGGGEA